MDHKTSPTDLTDAQWALIAPLIPPPPKPGGRPREVNIREVVNAIFYLTRSGCTWRLLPHDFPPWSTVHDYYHHWRGDGTWARIHNALRGQVRAQAARDPEPSTAILGSYLRILPLDVKDGIQHFMEIGRNQSSAPIMIRPPGGGAMRFA